MTTYAERQKLKEERAEKADRMLREKGDSMNKSEKAFVGAFKKDKCGLKKDASVPVGLVPVDQIKKDK